MKHTNRKISKISTMHFVKLFSRSLLFLAVLVCYILKKTEVLKENIPLLVLIWVAFVGEMILRFFPSKFESMGCQKQFKRNYQPKEDGKKPINQSWKRTAAVAGAWFLLNGLIGILYFMGWIDKGILFLIAIFYSVCDMICILFFCPFQVWFMKNRCCVSCRIYNWDFAMMFTPLIFIPSWYNYSLLGCALLLLISWEIAYKRYPERFSTETNLCLDCSKCQEKLCSHNKQLKQFIKKYRKKLT